MNIFKPSDFNVYTETGVYMGYISPTNAATLANKAFTKWIEKNGVRVYGNAAVMVFNPESMPGDTHQAMLVDIQEIVKPKCEHEPVADRYKLINDKHIALFGAAHCSKCGVKLKAKWEVEE